MPFQPSGASAAPSTTIGDRTRGQIAGRLLPFLFVLYIANYLDRTSVAYAALRMTSDLGFSDRVFGLGAGIFFLGYVALQIPGAMLVEHWSARRMISAVMIAWGSLTALTGLVHTANQLYLARLLLGAAEAGFFPGVIVYLSHWFGAEDRGKATGYFMAAIPLSQAIASPVAGWIVGRSFGGLQGWRWLFIFEGLPAVLLGVVAYFFLCDRPGEAHWLAPAERDWIEERLRREKQTDVRGVSVMQALCSPLVLLLAALGFLEYFVGYGFYFWFPTMLKRQSSLSDWMVGVVGVDSLCGDVCRHGFQWAALRQAHGATVARRRSGVRGGARSLGPRDAVPLAACHRSALHHDCFRECIPASILGHPHHAAGPFCRSRGGGIDQRGRIHRGIRFAVPAGLPQHAHGLVQRGNAGDYGGGNRRRLAPLLRSQTHARRAFVRQRLLRYSPQRYV